MNKKSKRITLGLVSALCLLLVVALGFGVTGAWYRARRQATGTVVLDQGIILTVTNLNQNTGVGTGTALTSSNKLQGSLWELNVVSGDNNDTLVALNASSTQPGATATKYIAVPTIKAAAGSTSFYAKAKLETKFTKFNAGHTAPSSETADTVDYSALYVRSGEGTQESPYVYTPVADTDIYSSAANAPQFANGWVSVGSHGWMMYGTNGTTPTTIAATDVDPVAILKDDAADSADAAIASTIGFDKVELKEWTGGDSIPVNQYVELGGPKFFVGTNYNSSEHTLENAAEFEVAQITYTITIDVIQQPNLTMGDGEAFETWRDAE